MIILKHNYEVKLGAQCPKCLQQMVNCVCHKELHSDWRLPTIKELLTLVDYETKTIPTSLDKSMKSFGYWSSTPLSCNPNNVWFVNFYYGNTYYNNKSVSHYVRCVRDGVGGLEWSPDALEEMNWYEAVEYAENLEARLKGFTPQEIKG